MMGRHDARQIDTYVLKGEGPEVWEPRFTLHGLRYAQLDVIGEAKVVKLEGRVVRSSLDSTGSFVSSNELLNKIHHNIQWTFMSSLQGIPQDAGERNERIGWLCDPTFVAEDYIYNYDMVNFREKWLENIRDTQKEDGDIAVGAPLHFRSLYDGAWRSWQSTYPVLLWELYQYYGDRGVLREHYESWKKLAHFLSAAAMDDLISEGLGDHVEPQDDGVTSYAPRHTPNELTATVREHPAYCRARRQFWGDRTMLGSTKSWPRRFERPLIGAFSTQARTSTVQVVKRPTRSRFIRISCRKSGSRRS